MLDSWWNMREVWYLVYYHDHFNGQASVLLRTQDLGEAENYALKYPKNGLTIYIQKVFE